MTTITANGQALNMLTFDPDPRSGHAFETRSKTLLHYSSDASNFTDWHSSPLQADWFSYPNGTGQDPSGGRVVSVSQFSGGTEVLSISGFDLAVTSLLGIAYNGTAEQYFALILDSVPGTNTINGSEFSDVLYGRGEADIISGNGGDDTILGSVGGDTLDGGAGTDTVDYSTSSGGVTVNLALSTASGGDAQGDIISGFENIIGSDVDGLFDLLTGDAGDNVITSGASRSVIDGGAGADTLSGGGGDDRVDYSHSSGAVHVNLATSIVSGGDAEGDIISGFESISGSGFNDVLIGDAGINYIRGGGGNDLIIGGAGADGALFGGDGIDTLSYAGSSAGVTVNLTTNTASGGDATGDVIAFFDGNPAHTIVGFENLTGSANADILTGNSGVNVIDGGSGNDTIAGGSGNDTLKGGIGNDKLTGGSGKDALSGGSGADSFIYTALVQSAAGAAHDLISDFSHAQLDKINLSAIDAVSGTAANDAFHLTANGGASGFSGVKGELHFVAGSTQTLIQGDVNGDKIADIEIALKGSITLVIGDFVL